MRRTPIVALLALVVLAGACSSSSSSSSKTAAPTTTVKNTSPTTTAPPIGHVFVINLENKSYEETWGANSVATYLNKTLRPQGQLLSNYYGIGHLSLDNYIAEISGQAPNPSTQGDCPLYTEFASTGVGRFGQLLGKGCVYPTTVKTVADQLTAAGKSWKAYQQDIGNSANAADAKTCRHPAIGGSDSTLIARLGDQYATRHDPFMYFHSIIDQSDCGQHVVGLDALTADLGATSTTPNYSFITPNLCDDGHDGPCKDGSTGGLVSADAWVKEWVPKIMSSAAYKADGLIILTFDEAETGGAMGDATACCHTPADPNAAQPGGTGPGGGRIGALLLSPHIKGGVTNSRPYNHYAMLCSVENIFGLDRLGFASAPDLACFGKDVFDS